MLKTDLIPKQPGSPKDENTRLLIQLTLEWFRNQDAQAYYSYHRIRGDIILQFEKITGISITDSQLDLFDMILESLEDLGYGHWCATQEDPQETDLFTYFYLKRAVTVNTEQIIWHFKMRRCEAWLKKLIKSSRFSPELRNSLILFKERLLKCKSKLDYENFKNSLFKSYDYLGNGARIVVQRMQRNNLLK